MDKCIYCGSEYAYHDGMTYNCPECGKEWTEHTIESMKIFDSAGNEIQEGDDVITIRDLKLGKGTLKEVLDILINYRNNIYLDRRK